MFERFTRFRSTRRGSAIIMMTIFAMIIGFSVATLMSFAVARRRETARLVVYNADLAAAEHMLDRIVSTSFFVGQNSPRQYAGAADGVKNLIAEMGEDTYIDKDGGEGDGFNDDLFMIQTRPPGNDVVDDTLIAELGPELAPWEGFTLQLESYQLVAWARATGDSDLAYAGSFNRPGVYVSRNVTYFAVPLLNFAIFYENLFELDGGARIDVFGKVHTNEDWYLTSSSSVYYNQNCTVAGRFFGGIYNPLDGSRRGWFSGSNNINIAKVRNPGLGPSDPATTMAQLYNPSLINYNKGYLSSFIYNPANPSNGNPVFDANNWLPRDYDSDGDGTIDDMNSDGDALDYLDGPDRFWNRNANWVDQARNMFNNFLRDSSHGVDDVRLPIEEQNSPYLLIEPPDMKSTIDPSDPRRQRPSIDGNGDAIFTTVEDVPVDPDDPNGPRMDKLGVSLAYQASVIIEPVTSDWDTISDSTFATRMTNATTADDPVKAYRYELSYDGDGNVVRTKVDFTKLWYNTGSGGNKTFVSKTKIYNGREEKYVYLLNIDAAALKDYVRYTDTADGAFKLSHPGEGLDHLDVDDGIIYVLQNQDLVGGNEEAGFRLTNASDLNGLVSYAGIEDYKGLTFATNAPLYTKGDVNKVNKIPLMLAGDSINPLSNAFNDGNYASGSGNGPVNSASNTETNAVFVSGNIPTRLNQYGGGGENYFRYIEGWGGKTHKYRGSILNLFESRVALGCWDKNTTTSVNSGYYGAPTRDWGWDPAYAAGQAPPGIPTSRQMSIGRWQLLNKDDVDAALANGSYTPL